MSDVLLRFPPTRTAALERLRRFLPHAGRDYASRRNYDLGRDRHTGVSQLSPYLRARLVTEQEVLRATLQRFSYASAEKFVQEVFWRGYWKGWLEMRPAVWVQYHAGLRRQIDALQTQSGLRDRWEAACSGVTDIDCFNAWARELVETGYLHNHARMWFASIWIFTLRLPWELGADFFLRHLLDGDPASNTLGWRWVAGLQTPGKTYLARASNIAKYTEGRFAPKWQLAGDAPALHGPPHPEPIALPKVTRPASNMRTGLLLHDDDLSPGFLLEGIRPVATARLNTRARLSPLHIAPHVSAFADGALDDTCARYDARLGPVTRVEEEEDIIAWASAEQLGQIVAPYASVGPNADLIAALRRRQDAPPIHTPRRTYDAAAWPHATKGFFAFRKHIPDLLHAVTEDR